MSHYKTSYPWLQCRSDVWISTANSNIFFYHDRKRKKIKKNHHPFPYITTEKYPKLKSISIFQLIFHLNSFIKNILFNNNFHNSNFPPKLKYIQKTNFSNSEIVYTWEIVRISNQSKICYDKCWKEFWKVKMHRKN